MKSVGNLKIAARFYIIHGYSVVFSQKYDIIIYNFYVQFLFVGYFGAVQLLYRGVSSDVPYTKETLINTFSRFSKCLCQNDIKDRKLVHFSKRRNERFALISFFLISNQP